MSLFEMVLRHLRKRGEVAAGAVKRGGVEREPLSYKYLMLGESEGPGRDNRSLEAHRFGENRLKFPQSLLVTVFNELLYRESKLIKTQVSGASPAQSHS